MMRFGVLGPLNVLDDDGQTVPVSSSKQRLLLAVLLAHRNTLISTDRLVDALWEGRPPPSARTNLQGHVHRLRRLIGESRIVHRQASYELTVRPDETDDGRFEELAHHGRQALDAGDAQRAADLLREALQLWRGPHAYAGAAGTETVGVEAVRLDEVRHITLERRIDADLRLGHHDRLIPELTTLVAAYPLRQRLHIQLMLALHGSGRTAEALGTYRRARQIMVDELGLEPGAELKNLEQAIITGDPALDLAPVSGPESSSQVPPPAELPAPDPSFTGRHQELAALVNSLSGVNDEPAEPPAVVAVDGPAGVGKSALALHAAHSVAGRYPDGALYIDLKGATPGRLPLDPRDVLTRFLRTLGISDAMIPGDTDGAAALFRSTLSRRRMLVVLDDAHDAAQVRPLLPGPNSPSAVLLTCRRALTTIAGVRHIRLDALSADEAVVLLARLAGPDRVAADPDIATATVRLCAHLPLAVRIVGARLMSRPDWPLSAMYTRLSNVRGRLDELQHDDLAVRASLDVAYRMLPDTAADVLAHLGLVDLHEFTAHSAAALTGRLVAQVRRDLDTLVESQLVTPAPGERFVLHDLLRLYAREKAETTFSAAYRTAATRRVADDAQQQALALTNLGLALHLAGRAEDAAEAYEHALKAADNVHVRGLALSRLCAAYRDADRPGDALACAEQAVDIFQAAGWSFDEALARWLRGELLERLDCPAEARQQWSHAVRVLKSIGAMSDQEAADLLAAPVPSMPDVLRRYRPGSPASA